MVSRDAAVANCPACGRVGPIWFAEPSAPSSSGAVIILLPVADAALVECLSYRERALASREQRRAGEGCRLPRLRSGTAFPRSRQSQPGRRHRSG